MKPGIKWFIRLFALKTSSSQHFLHRTSYSSNFTIWWFLWTNLRPFSALFVILSHWLDYLSFLILYCAQCLAKSSSKMLLPRFFCMYHLFTTLALSTYEKVATTIFWMNSHTIICNGLIKNIHSPNILIIFNC